MKTRKYPPGLVVGTLICSLLALAVILGPVVMPFDPVRGQLTDRLMAPSGNHLLGTDSLGRDILARILKGGRLTLTMGFGSMAVAASVGTILGVTAAYRGGWADTIIMRAMDILLALPGMILAIAMVAILGTGLEKAMLAVAMHRIPAFARVARASTMSVLALPYVEAARACGSSTWRIAQKHLLPNIVNSIIVLGTINLGTCILSASSLGFLGLGAQPPDPEWGVMLSEARVFLRVAPHTAMFPGIAIAITVLGLNLLGDGLRDKLDPRLTRSSI